MNRFRAYAVAGALITLSTITSACTTANGDQTSSIRPSMTYYEEGYYQDDYALNPACAGGFSNDRPCSY